MMLIPSRKFHVTGWKTIATAIIGQIDCISIFFRWGITTFETFACLICRTSRSEAFANFLSASKRLRIVRFVCEKTLAWCPEVKEHVSDKSSATLCESSNCLVEQDPRNRVLLLIMHQT